MLYLYQILDLLLFKLVLRFHMFGVFLENDHVFGRYLFFSIIT